MQQSDFGKRCGHKVGRVSIGAMRFPADGLDAVALIRKAIDAGMRYIDTSRGYGESEFILGKALKNGYREKVILSTKSSPWIKKIREDDLPDEATVRRRIEESLLRLDVDYLDFYQVWNIHSRDCWDKAVKKGGMVDGIKKAMQDGLVKHTGFTTHDSVENLLEYLEIADWCEILLTSYNLLNKTYAPVIEKAHQKGIGTVVMNPVGGGKLTKNTPVFEKLCRELGADEISEVAQRFVLSNPNIDTFLCGFSKESDIDKTLDAEKKGAYSEEELAKIDQFFKDHAPEKQGYCTDCKYCIPCPQGINIPRIMGLIYEDRFLGLKGSAKHEYKWVQGSKADACVACGICEGKCTQGLPIIKEMEYAHQNYGQG